jgi:hypothetical protein
MDMDSLIDPKTGQPIVKNVRRRVIEKDYDWGLYIYKKANGRYFSDGHGSVLNIPSMRGDIAKISELKQAAIHYGDPGNGTVEFIAGSSRVSEEEYSEQVDRMNSGLLPNLNDLGAVQAAKDTIALYGDEE